MNNNVYIYNNSFISLLNLVDTLINNNIKPLNIKNSYYMPNLLDNIVILDIIEDSCIINKYLNIISKNIIKTIYYVFLSNNETKELIIYYFILNCIKYKNKIIYLRNLKCVDKVLKISHYVVQENHKLKGFIRFKELKNNVLYAEISPENNILELLSYHFKKRLKNELWIIKDVNRKLLSIYNKKNFYILTQNDFKLLNKELSENEIETENLWKLFYNTIGINERKNYRCRMSFMPKKYWKYILEMSDEYEKSNN